MTLVAVALGHLALVAWLLHGIARPATAPSPTPLAVTLLTGAEPAPVAPPDLPLQAHDRPLASVPSLPVPILNVEAAAALPAPRAPEPSAAVATPVTAVPTPVEVAPMRIEVPAIVTAPAPAPPAAPPPRKRLEANAVRYLVTPPAEVPRASRRAGESGVVWLRVVVDVHGLPSSVSVHRSSGYPRLDEQALAAMRQARFTPHLEDGRAVEVEVIAPIEYPPG